MEPSFCAEKFHCIPHKNNIGDVVCSMMYTVSYFQFIIP